MIDRWTDGQTDKWIENGQMDGCTDRATYVWTDVYIDEMIEGWMDKQVDRKMDKMTSGWMDREMH